MSEVLFSCKIQVPKHGIKKNSKEIRMNFKTKQRFIGSNNRVLNTQKYLLTKLQIEKLKKRLDCISCDINIAMIFYFPKTVFYTKKNDRSKLIADLSNLYQLVEDCLQKIKIIENDSLICSHDGSARKPIDDNNHWLEIIISKI